MKHRIFFIFLLLILQGGFQAKSQGLGWTSWEHLNDSLRKAKKPLLIFIHTDWCKYCRMQENSTFTDAELIRVLNQDFYCLQLDAETTDEIIFLGKKYTFQTSGAGTGHHSLAQTLGKEQGKLSFPTTVLLNKNLQIVCHLPGFVSKEVFKETLNKFRG
ncbi:MAG: thioredoxin family protein [Microscillaceae bacterium]|nr:thioredoxin family protein [Microscillaceae bacterium]